MKAGRRAHPAVFVPDLQAGGVARFAVTLTAAFADRGHRVDLVVCGATGPFLGQVPDSVDRMIDRYLDLLLGERP